MIDCQQNELQETVNVFVATQPWISMYKKNTRHSMSHSCKSAIKAGGFALNIGML